MVKKQKKTPTKAVTEEEVPTLVPVVTPKKGKKSASKS